MFLEFRIKGLTDLVLRNLLYFKLSTNITMKKIFLALCLTLLSTYSFSQTATDFTKTDCSGTTHHLFSEVNNDTIVFLEFVMTCTTCANVGHKIEATIARLQSEFPTKSFRFYQLAYTNTYTCATMVNWQGNNNFSCPAFDSGATLVAQYGGFGMPTVAIIGGDNHTLCYNSLGYIDTAAAGTAVRNLFQTTGVNVLANSAWTISPNPATDFIQIKIENPANASLEIFDMNGRLIYATQNASSVLDIDTHLWNKGNYVVRLRQSNNTSTQTISIQ
jgi:hypothetical protein